MPRILPRLIEGLQATKPKKPFEPFNLHDYRARSKSIRKPLPPTPSFHPADYSQSILLSPGNPIISSRDYIRHKSLPPRVRLPKDAIPGKNAYDRPRNMTEEERRWWASPYLRMASTPLRRCFQTSQLLPSAFLIRLGVFRTPSAKQQLTFSPKYPPTAILMPDGLEHPKFRGRKSGKAGYVLCWKDAVEHIELSGKYKRTAYNVRLYSKLKDQIYHLLRLRVLQELQLVIDGLRYRPKSLADKSLIRKLTREEWKEFKSTGTMPVPNAMAVIVVPPLNRHPETKERPKGSMSSLPPSEITPRIFERPPLPVCTLHPTATTIEGLPEDIHLSKSRIPLYHGVALFPNPGQRAALLAQLCRILNLERNARRLSVDLNTTEKTSSKESRASHAFVLMSDETTALTADMGGVGMALWRIAMFEGMGWNDRSTWVKRYQYSSVWGDEKYLV